MDAINKILVVCAGIVVLLTAGCEFPQSQGPAARRESPAPTKPQLTSDTKSSQPVAAADESVENVDQAVQGYIAQIDNIGQRTQRQPSARVQRDPRLIPVTYPPTKPKDVPEDTKALSLEKS